MEIRVEINPGNSEVQKQAEQVMISWLESQLSCSLKPQAIKITDEVRVEVDGFSQDPLILCEAWAHQGNALSAQKYKIMNDAMKMMLARSVIGTEARAILLFADEKAASHFQGKSWQASALVQNRIEIFVAQISNSTRIEIQEAQRRQRR